jgi:hypothetical protein
LRLRPVFKPNRPQAPETELGLTPDDLEAAGEEQKKGNAPAREDGSEAQAKKDIIAAKLLTAQELADATSQNQSSTLVEVKEVEVKAPETMYQPGTDNRS